MDKQKEVFNICANGKTYATIIYKEYKSEGIQFFTDECYSQQIAYMHHPDGKLIEAHTHNIERRDVYFTQEVLIIRKGKLRVDFYHENQEYYRSVILGQGDIILLISGGHGFKVIEEVEMIEVKQGPYLGDKDKIRFAGIKDEGIRWVE